MNGKLENNVTPARGRARFRPGHPMYTGNAMEGERSVRVYTCAYAACVYEMRIYVRASRLTHPRATVMRIIIS